MKTFTLTIDQRKNRINSKHWETVRQFWLNGEVLPANPQPKARSLYRVVTGAPDSIDLEGIRRMWDSVDMISVPFLFQFSPKLGITFEEFQKEVQPKLDGKTDFASIMLRPVPN